MNPTRFTIYFDTLGVPDMQFSESICIIDVDVNLYKIILYYLLWVLSIAQINSTEVSSYLLIFILLQILYVITYLDITLGYYFSGVYVSYYVSIQ